MPHPYTDIQFPRTEFAPPPYNRKKKENQINEGNRAVACHILDYFWKTGGAFALIPPKSYHELAGVHSTNRQGKRLQLRQRTKKPKKKEILGVNAYDLKKKMVLNQKIKLRRF